MNVVKQVVQQKSKIEPELTGPELSSGAPLNSAQLISAQPKKTLLDPPLKQNNLCFEAMVEQCTSN